MTLAQKYRTQFTTQQADRLVLFLATAVVLHLGAIAVGLKLLQVLLPEPTAKEDVVPIEFVYLDEPEQQSPPPDTQRRSVANIAVEAAPQATPQKPEAGKPSPLAGKDITAPTPPKTISSGLQPASADPPRGKPISPVPSVTPLPTAAPKSTPVPQPDKTSSAAVPELDSPNPTVPTLPPTESQAADSQPTNSQPDSLPKPPEGSATLPTPQTVPPPAPEETTPDPSEPSEPPSNLPAPSSAPESGFDGAGLSGAPRANQADPDTVSIAAARDQAMGAYQQAINRRIEQYWQEVPVTVSRQAKVRFVVDRAGNVIDVELVESSGLASADEAAIAAIQAATPFNPLPDLYEAETLAIRFTFNYEVSEPAL